MLSLHSFILVLTGFTLFSLYVAVAAVVAGWVAVAEWVELELVVTALEHALWLAPSSPVSSAAPAGDAAGVDAPCAHGAPFPVPAA